MAGRNTTKGGGASAPDSPESDRIRIDKWLFYARFFKTRALAATIITKGRLRVNGQKQPKPGHAIGPGDVLTFPMGDRVRVIRMLNPGTRRGPAAEAQSLYTDLEPLAPPATASPLE